jgi:hypothetical protein
MFRDQSDSNTADSGRVLVGTLLMVGAPISYIPDPDGWQKVRDVMGKLTTMRAAAASIPRVLRGRRRCQDLTDCFGAQ